MSTVALSTTRASDVTLVLAYETDGELHDLARADAGTLTLEPEVQP